MSTIPRADFFSTQSNDAGQVSGAIGFVIRGADIQPNQNPQASGQHKMAFQSREMVELVRQAIEFAESSASVMITGESGTGKELFSRLVHDKSKRAKQNFVAVNCAAIPEALMESEIFGHERGAFTGAVQKRTGYFERANQGTLLLDEVSEIPVNLQAKLLRVIEEQEVQAVGGDRPRGIDVRVVATSNRDLKTEVAAGRFRSDLYHRLNVLEINIPPLRQRTKDIPLLVMRFLEMFRGESKVEISGISKEAMQWLCDYHWPGNVRELRNVIHRACIVTKSNEITVDALPTSQSEIENAASDDESHSFVGMPLAEVERKLIIACLKKFDGNKRSAAEALGVTARTLSNKMKQYRQCDVENR